MILQQVSEQSAADIAVELRRRLDGPVFDTLTAVNHPELRAGRLDLVAAQFAAGLEAYPHVERFFAWHAQTDAVHPRQVMFYGRNGKAATDPILGPAIFDLARRHATAQQIYVAAERLARGSPHQVLLRLFWTDARRIEYFAILGFVVEPSQMREQLFANPLGAQLRSVAARHGAELPLQLRVTDETGAIVYGHRGAGVHGAQASFPMSFYPDEIHSRLAAGVAPRNWAIDVSLPPLPGGWSRLTDGYGASILSVILLLMALALTIQAHRRSAELARMQTDFVAHVSHQLKTPLSLLSAATETLEMDRVRSPERFAEYLRTIHAEAERLSLLVQRVLEFSRVQQRRDYEFERADLGALVRETVAAFAHGLSAQGYSFEVRDDDAPAMFVRADPAALEQVLANLLDNAVKYSGENKAIVVTVRAAKGFAVVEVIDRGVGIAPRDQRRIFERFYRPSESQRPGFGLGLPIVKELIQAHRGTVEVTSTPGHGSTFTIRLPLDAPDRAADASLPAEPSKAAS